MNRAAKRARGRFALATVAALATVTAIGGCRHKERLAPVEFAAEEGAGGIDAESSLAPAWPPPVRADLDNGAIVQWLHEPHTPAFHLRLLVPTGSSHDDDASSAASTAVVATALRLELLRRVRRYGGSVDVESRPGRVEIAVHGLDDDAERILAALTQVVSDRKPARVLAQAQGKALAAHQPADPSARAAAALIAALVGVDASRERVDKQSLVALDADALERAWERMLDPREVVIVVHAGRPATALAEPISKLAGTWTARGRRSSESSVLTRLRRDAKPKRPKTRVLADPAAPLIVADRQSDGRAVVMLGRVIPTPGPRDRAQARLVQRMLQEELDARLLIAGDVALFSLRVSLSKGDPAKSVEKALDRLDRFASTEHQPQRMRQAAHLWLGARVVEASLSGEDWTALWSEAIDLSTSDDEIVAALARDAAAMLDADKKAIREWQEKWIRPRGGEPGWVWVASGVDDDTLAKLRELTSVTAAD